jgi:hypothetical protein
MKSVFLQIFYKQVLDFYAHIDIMILSKSLGPAHTAPQLPFTDGAPSPPFISELSSQTLPVGGWT